MTLPRLGAVKANAFPTSRHPCVEGPISRLAVAMAAPVGPRCECNRADEHQAADRQKPLHHPASKARMACGLGWVECS